MDLSTIEQIQKENNNYTTILDRYSIIYIGYKTE